MSGNGYHSVDGMLTKGRVSLPVAEEEDLFLLAGVPWVSPDERGAR
jgi:hypothetical protein